MLTLALLAWNPWSGKPAASPAPALPIVVLPLESLDEATSTGFADALTVDLNAELGRLASVFVISTGTAATYKGKPADPREVARALGVVDDNYLGRSCCLTRECYWRLVVVRVRVFGFVIEGGGHVGEGLGGGQRLARSAALSTAEPGAPQAHRPHVHRPPGAKRPAPWARCIASRDAHASVSATGFLNFPRIRSFAFSARHALIRRCMVRSCALLA